jgi:hypothetical protein
MVRQRLNQTMETYLRCFVNACPSKWSDWLSLAEFWYNGCFHSAIGRSPFEALYGYAPRHFGIQEDTSVAVPDLSSWLRERQLMNTLIKQHLTRSRLRMKRQEDKHRSERVFAVGDMVFLKMQPYVQTSLAPRSNQKLAFKYYGPFRVVARIGKVAYKLLLSESSSTHPVFHISQLKQTVSDTTEVIPVIPSDVDHHRVPQKILQKRMVTKGVKPVQQVLIQWSGWPLEMATWEDAIALQQLYPFAPAWGQAGVHRRGNVSSKPNQVAAEEEERQGPRPRKANTRVSGPEWSR